MRMSIKARGFSLTEALANHVRRRFKTALRHASRRLDEVTIRLRDINGRARGGIDKHCQVELRFAHGSPLVIRETDANLYTAIDRAAGRSKRNVLKRIVELRSRRRTRARALKAHD